MKIQIFCEVVQNFPRSPSENVPYHLQFFTANLGLCLVELLVQVSFGIFFFTTKRKMANSNETYHQLPCKQRSLQSHRVTTSMHICSLLRLQRCFGVSRNAPPKETSGEHCATSQKMAAEETSIFAVILRRTCPVDSVWWHRIYVIKRTDEQHKMTGFEQWWRYTISYRKCGLK